MARLSHPCINALPFINKKLDYLLYRRHTGTFHRDQSQSRSNFLIAINNHRYYTVQTNPDLAWRKRKSNRNLGARCRWVYRDGLDPDRTRSLLKWPCSSTWSGSSVIRVGPDQDKSARVTPVLITVLPALWPFTWWVPIRIVKALQLSLLSCILWMDLRKHRWFASRDSTSTNAHCM